MSIAVVITDRNTDELCQHIQAQLPEVFVQQHPHITQPEQVKLAVLWAHPNGVTKNMMQLQMVVSMGAGMDHIDNDDNIPLHIKRHRIVTSALKQNMAQYVLQHILADHRHAQEYANQQFKQVWQVLETDRDMPTIGFLGLGALGGFVADQCAALGFGVMAFTQQQQHPSYPCFQGASGLQYVCENSDYLVVLLPLNAETSHIINKDTLKCCRPNCVLINVGRGHHINETDLINALDNYQLKKAVLDVFQQEPLPVDHPYWSHSKIIITPHSSSRSDVRQTAQAIVNYYRSMS